MCCSPKCQYTCDSSVSTRTSRDSLSHSLFHTHVGIERMQRDRARQRGTQRHAHRDMHTETCTQRHAHRDMHTETCTQRHAHRHIQTETVTKTLRSSKKSMSLNATLLLAWISVRCSFLPFPDRICYWRARRGDMVLRHGIETWYWYERRGDSQTCSAIYLSKLARYLSRHAIHLFRFQLCSSSLNCVPPLQQCTDCGMGPE